MKSKWLLIVACLLIAACDNTAKVTISEDNPDPPTKTNVSAKSDTTENNDAAIETADAKAADSTPAETKLDGDTGTESNQADAKTGSEASKTDDQVADQQDEDKSNETTADTDDKIANADQDVDTADDEEVKDESTPAELAYEAALGKHRAAMDEFTKAYSSAEDADARQKVFEELYPKGADFADEMFAVAEKFNDTPQAFMALSWIASNADGEAQDKAYDVILKDHIENPKLKSLATGLGYGMPSPKIEERLNKIIEKSPHDDIKASASFSLARFLGGLEQMKDAIVGNPEFESQVGEEVVAYLKDVKVDAAKIEALYQKVSDDYGDLILRGDQTFAEAAEAALFEIRNLAIGKIAPDIEGEDLDSVAFKLSDYRGKVVVLDFWGDW